LGSTSRLPVEVIILFPPEEKALKGVELLSQESDLLGAFIHQMIEDRLGVILYDTNESQP
jgi:hypothetical protein